MWSQDVIACGLIDLSCTITLQDFRLQKGFMVNYCC